MNLPRARLIGIVRPNLAPEQRPGLALVSMEPKTWAAGRFGWAAVEGQLVVEGQGQHVVEGQGQPVVEGQLDQVPSEDFPGQQATLRSSIKRGGCVS